MKRITLKSLSSSTTIEVFLYVKQHLLTQNETSKRGNFYSADENMCAYKSPDKLMCAAGCLMTTREYKRTFEGRNWRSLVNEGLVPRAHMKLIMALQCVHDEYDPSDWKILLDGIEEDIKKGVFDK